MLRTTIGQCRARVNQGHGRLSCQGFRLSPPTCGPRHAPPSGGAPSGRRDDGHGGRTAGERPCSLRRSGASRTREARAVPAAAPGRGPSRARTSSSMGGSSSADRRGGRHPADPLLPDICAALGLPHAGATAPQVPGSAARTDATRFSRHRSHRAQAPSSPCLSSSRAK